MDKKCLIIIDGNAILHRAFHALPSLTAKSGQLVNAIYGFLLVFFKTIREFRPEFVAVTFDLAGPTFRHKKFKEYKAKRIKAPEEFYQQIPLLKEILKKFNISIFEKKGYEADDVIGTIIEKVKSQKFPASPSETGQAKVKSIVITGDLDTLQLIEGEEVNVYALKKGIKDTVLYDAAKVQERYDIEPKKLLDFKALRGDPSDNIPGVFGIGEKTAVKLIKEFGSLENLYKEIDSGRAGAVLKQSLFEKLKKYKEQAFLSKMLAQIKTDVPIDFNLEKCRWGEYDKAKVIKIFNNYGFKSLINRLSEFNLPASSRLTPDGNPEGENNRKIIERRVNSEVTKNNLRLW